MDVPSSFEGKSVEENETFIKQAINYYETNSQTFTETLKTAILSLVATLQRSVNANPATNMAEINVDYNKIEKEIEIAKSDLEAAKTRVETLRKPDEQSYYESWFPINRPLRRSSIFIVLIIGIFLFILSFMIAIRALGIYVDVSIAAPPDIIRILLRLFPWQSLVLIGILIIIATLALLRKI